MTLAEAITANSTQVATTEKAGAKPLAELVKASEDQFRLALPRTITPERFTRLALTELRTVKDLNKCTPTSFLAAIMLSAQLGLEPGSALGHCYMIPRKRNGVLEVQFMLGYKGMLELARRSGQLKRIEAHEVYEADVFEYSFGSGGKLVHRPVLANRGDVIAYYAFAELKDGGEQYVVLTVGDIDKRRKRSGAGDNGPWGTDYDAMARKTVIRELFKFLPVATEAQTAAALDEAVIVQDASEGVSLDAFSGEHDVIEAEVVEDDWPTTEPGTWSAKEWRALTHKYKVKPIDLVTYARKVADSRGDAEVPKDLDDAIKDAELANAMADELRRRAK